MSVVMVSLPADVDEIWMDCPIKRACSFVMVRAEEAWHCEFWLGDASLLAALMVFICSYEKLDHWLGS